MRKIQPSRRRRTPFRLAAISLAAVMLATVSALGPSEPAQATVAVDSIDSSEHSGPALKRRPCIRPLAAVMPLAPGPRCIKILPIPTPAPDVVCAVSATWYDGVVPSSIDEGWGFTISVVNLSGVNSAYFEFQDGSTWNDTLGGAGYSIHRPPSHADALGGIVAVTMVLDDGTTVDCGDIVIPNCVPQGVAVPPETSTCPHLDGGCDAFVMFDSINGQDLYAVEWSGFPRWEGPADVVVNGVVQRAITNTWSFGHIWTNLSLNDTFDGNVDISIVFPDGTVWDCGTATFPG